MFYNDINLQKYFDISQYYHFLVDSRRLHDGHGISSKILGAIMPVVIPIIFYVI